MRLHRRVKIEYAAVDSDGTCELPDGAVIIHTDFADQGGIHFGRAPVGVWFERVTERVNSPGPLPGPAGPGGPTSG